MTGILISALVLLLTVRILLVAKTRNDAKRAKEKADAEREVAEQKAYQAQQEKDREAAQHYIDNLKKNKDSIIVENGILKKKKSAKKSTKKKPSKKKK